MPNDHLSLPPSGLRHHALPYADRASYVDALVAYVDEGLAAGEPVLAAVPEPGLESLEEALGPQAARVQFVDLAEWGRNPWLIIPTVLRAFLDAHGGRRTRIVAEALWPDRAPEETWLAVRHEALVNRVLAGYPTTILCPWDAAGLAGPVLAFAARTHPVLVVDGVARPSLGFAEPERVVAALSDRLPVRAPVDVEVPFDLAELGVLQDVIGRYGERVGLGTDRVWQLQQAVAEIAEPALATAGAPGTLRLSDGPDRVVCEILTPGAFREPTAGLLHPTQDSPRGRGLLAANRLCDLVETHDHPDSTTTRLVIWR